MKGFIIAIITLLLIFLVFLPILHMGGKISLKEYYEGVTNWVPEETPEDYTARNIEEIQEDLRVAPKAEELLTLERKILSGQQLSDEEMAEAEKLRKEIKKIRRVDQKWSDVGKKINGGIKTIKEAVGASIPPETQSRLRSIQQVGWSSGAANNWTSDVKWFGVSSVEVGDGNRLVIRYPWYEGVLQGNLKDHSYRGEWIQSGGRGGFELQFNPDFTRADGWWATSDAPNQRYFFALK